MVWATPMSRLGEQFGMTGNGLAKICARLDVPRPGRGYWAKKEAGGKVKTTPLPRAKAGKPTEVMLARRKVDEASRRSPTVKIALNEAQAKVAPLNPVEAFKQPHAIIAGWLADHAKKAKEARGEREPWRRDLYQPAPFTEQDHRRHRVLNVILKELERHGASVRAERGNLLIATVEGQNVSFELREKLKQGQRPLTELEKHVPSIYGTSRFELQPTGLLLFSIKSYLDGTLRREWLEKAGEPIDNMLPRIIATILAAGPAMAEQQRKSDELRRAYEAECARREAEARARQKEVARWRKLVEMAGAWEELRSVRDFISALRASDCDPAELVGDRSIAEWIEWAEARLRQHDPLGNGVSAAIRRLHSAS